MAEHSYTVKLIVDDERRTFKAYCTDGTTGASFKVEQEWEEKPGHYSRDEAIGDCITYVRDHFDQPERYRVQSNPSQSHRMTPKTVVVTKKE